MWCEFKRPSCCLQLELILSSATVMMALYSLVAGIFGMNLPYKWNDGYGYLFKWVGRPTPVALCMHDKDFDCVFFLQLAVTSIYDLIAGKL